MDIAFRKASVEDCRGTLELLTERHREIHPDEPVPFAENGEELFRNTISSDSSYLIIGEKDGRIVATATVYILPRIRLGGYFALLESVMVTRDFRRAGVGTKLITYVIEACRKDPRIRKVKLGSKKDEEGVHSFYEKLGFIYKEKLFQLSLK